MARVVKVLSLILLISCVANIWLAVIWYRSTRISWAKQSNYSALVTAIGEATQFTDSALTDTSLSQRTQDEVYANYSISQAIGHSEGLTADADRLQIDFAPTMFALRYAMMPNQVTNSDWSQEKQISFVKQSDKILRTLQSALKGTTYANGGDLKILKNSVAELNSSLMRMNVPGANN